MLLDLTLIRGPRERVERTWPAEALDTSGDDFAIVEPVALAMDVHKLGEKYRLTGAAKTVLELACSRCLEPFRFPVDALFDLTYLPQVENTGEGEIEIGGDDLGTAWYRDDAIDLAELLREQFNLALPMKPLCREDCRGLCPECGTNLNLATCDCRPAWRDPRLAGLTRFLAPSGEGDR
ncbi:MAG TPA: DUF177 domain-containing protein [Vicinamibacterales bacterium]|nr:DUF177 domain-containing protein [Vicinamibacterales bacterium]